jgi:hypothetical protein
MDSGERLSLAICSIEMRFDPEDVDHAIRLLLSVRGSIQAKRGCRVGEVGMEASDPGADLLNCGRTWPFQARSNNAMDANAEDFVQRGTGN